MRLRELLSYGPGVRSARAGVLILSIGNVLAQAVPLAAAIVLARLYDPEEFGIFGVFVSVCSLLAAVAGGRYELAIVVPRSDRLAKHVLLLTLIIAVTVCSASQIMIVIGWGSFTSFGVLSELGNLLYLVPIFTFCIAAFQAFSYWLNRRGDYLGMAGGVIALKCASEASRIGAGILPVPFNGLIAGGLLGQAFGASVLCIRATSQGAFTNARIRLRRLRAAAYRYRKFPLFTLPYGLVATLATESVTIALVGFGYIQAAGFYALTRRVVISPIGLLSASVGRVFFKEAASALGTPRLQSITDRAIVAIAAIFAPLWIFAALWAPDLFAVLFGAEWRQAGVYAAILAPMAFLFLFTSWPERMYEVTQRQEVSLAIQSVSDMTRIGALFAMLMWGYSPVESIVVYVGISVIYHVVYLAGIYVVGNLRFDILKQVGLMAVLISIVSAALTYLSRELIDNGILSFLLPVCVFVLYYSYLVKIAKAGRFAHLEGRNIS